MVTNREWGVDVVTELLEENGWSLVGNGNIPILTGVDQSDEVTELLRGMDFVVAKRGNVRSIRMSAKESVQVQRNRGNQERHGLNIPLWEDALELAYTTDDIDVWVFFPTAAQSERRELPARPPTLYTAPVGHMYNNEVYTCTGDQAMRAFGSRDGVKLWKLRDLGAVVIGEADRVFIDPTR